MATFKTDRDLVVCNSRVGNTSLFLRRCLGTRFSFSIGSLEVIKLQIWGHRGKICFSTLDFLKIRIFFIRISKKLSYLMFRWSYEVVWPLKIFRNINFRGVFQRMQHPQTTGSAPKIDFLYFWGQKWWKLGIFIKKWRLKVNELHLTGLLSIIMV